MTTVDKVNPRLKQRYRDEIAGQLQEQFGPEYDRTVGTAESKREAEAELQAREERRRKLEIRPLPSAARYRYLEAWQGVQSQFVDEPSAAVARADELIQSVMSERGYPVEDFEQRAADVSVDHPHGLLHVPSGGSRVLRGFGTRDSGLGIEARIPDPGSPSPSAT